MTCKEILVKQDKIKIKFTFSKLKQRKGKMYEERRKWNRGGSSSEWGKMAVIWCRWTLGGGG